MNCALEHLLLGLDRLVGVVDGLGLLDQREHVAHAEDAARHAVGMERLERVELLADAGEEDRQARDFLDRQRGAAACVAVELGQDDAGERDGLGKRLGNVHRLLAGHRVDDEDGVVRLEHRAHLRELVHEVGVDLQTAGRVDDEDVAAESLGFGERAARNRHRVRRLE